MNKYSVLIVDDEKLSRQNTYTMIDWPKLEIYSIFQAEDGYKALEIIQNHMPHIIILDLRMPKVSGIDIIDIINEKKIDLQIIVLSGYRDFKAAQKMLEAGTVMSYLIKPTSEDLLIESIIKCIANIEEKNKTKQTIEELERIKDAVLTMQLKNLILGLNEEIIEEPIRIDNYSRMCVVVVSCETDIIDVVKYCTAKSNETDSCIVEVLSIENKKRVLLLFGGQSNDFLNNVFSECKTIESNTGCIIGVGGIIRDSNDLNISYREALLASESRLLINNNPIYFNEINNYKNINNINIENIRKVIQSGDMSRAEKVFEEYIKIIMINDYNGKPFSPEDIADLSALKLRFKDLFEKIFQERWENINLINIYIADSFKTILSESKQTFIRGCHQSYSVKSDRKKNLVYEAKRFIDKHYMEKVTLNKVAGAVYINPSYLSSLFTLIEGHTFVDYLTKIRISKAKELLRDRNCKIYEVAELVGYNSIKHFLKVFKNNQGMTPAEYREKHMFD